MKLFRSLLSRCRGFLQKKEFDADMAEQMRLHVELSTERNIASGMTREDARYAALRKFGGMEQLKEVCREERSFMLLDHLIQDLRYALRSFGKARGFAFVVILILGLGIGVNTTMFTYVNSLFGSPPSLGEPESAVIVTNITPQGLFDNMPYGAYESLRDQTQTLVGLAAVMQGNSTRPLVVAGQSGSTPVQVLGVSGNLFSVLGLRVAPGRALTPRDDTKDTPSAVAVLSHGFWQRQFGADPAAIGKTVVLEKMVFEIVGIAPPGFTGVDPGRQPVDLFVPIQAMGQLDSNFASQLRPRAGSVFFLIGRLKPGITRQTAAVDMDVIYQRWLIDARYSDAQRSTRGKLALESGGRGRVDRGRGAKIEQAAVLMGVVGLVLILACANVASLLLARLAGRRREFAMRAALGASRGRLVRQLLTESLVLAVAGSAIGLLLPALANVAIRQFNLGPQLDPTPNGIVLLLTLGVSVGTGIFVGLLPAFQYSRTNLMVALHSGSARTGSRQLLGKALVVLQLVISVCLLTGTGLFVRTLRNLQQIDLGFARENMLVAVLAFDRSYDVNRQGNLAKDCLTALAAVPGVTSVSLSGGGAWTSGRIIRGPLTIEGYTPPPGEDLTANVVLSGPQMIGTMGIRMVRGRDFTAADVFQTNGPATGGAVINEAVARRFFGSADPIGRQLTVTGRRFEVIGITKATRYAGLRDDGGLQVHVPYFNLGPQESLALVLRTAIDPAALVNTVSSEITRIDPNIKITRVAPIDEAVSRAVAPERLVANLAGSFGAFALLLACFGLYGLLSYNVAQRTREIGVRMALGAQVHDVRLMVVKQGVRLALMGCVAGSLVAIFFGIALSKRLYGVSAADPITLIGTTSLLLAVTLLACWLPARRATKVDPMMALRCE